MKTWRENLEPNNDLAERAGFWKWLQDTVDYECVRARRSTGRGLSRGKSATMQPHGRILHVQGHSGTSDLRRSQLPSTACKGRRGALSRFPVKQEQHDE